MVKRFWFEMLLNSVVLKKNGNNNLSWWGKVVQTPMSCYAHVIFPRAMLPAFLCPSCFAGVILGEPLELWPTRFYTNPKWCSLKVFSKIRVSSNHWSAAILWAPPFWDNSTRVSPICVWVLSLVNPHLEILPLWRLRSTEALQHLRSSALLHMRSGD